VSDSEPVFIGIGEQPSGRYPNRPFMGDLVRVGVAAVKDAGLTTQDIDTILLIPCLHSPADQADLVFSRIVEELGLNKKVKCQYMVHSGGSTSDNTIRTAAGLIDSGHAKNVLVLQAEKWGSAPVTEMIDMLTANGIPREWEKQSGLSFNAVGALIQQRYMFESGSTPADMASVCVALRDWANLNPNAMYKDKKLTVEQVLNSKMITDPIRAFECPMLADGACALVLTSRSNARTLGKDRVVRIAGESGVVSHYSIGQEREVGKLGWELAGPAAYEAAGWGPEDADIAEIYDSYAAVLTSGLEGLGLAPKGEAARMFARGEFSPGGRLPTNTNGGLLSAGHTGVGGGTALLTEGVRQLLGRAGERQVDGATRAVLGGSGGTYMDSQVLLLEGVSA
jgi:acetyl-CoA acetyltransferase